MSRNEEIMQIMLWGPSGAGKDYLIQGFIKETEKINTDEYEYKVDKLDEKDRPGLKLSEAPLPVSTSTSETRLLKFRREYRHKANKRKKNPFHINYYHLVEIHNNLGGDLIKIPSEDPTITAPFKTSKNFIVVMDPPTESAGEAAKKRSSNDEGITKLIQEFSSDDYSETVSLRDSRNSYTGHSREDQYRNLKRFFAQLDSIKTESKRLVAICLTQADKHEHRGKPETTLEKLFGEACLKLIESYNNNTTYSIKIFVTTTEGFDSPKEDSGNPSIKNPTNAASPFFWFFEEAEKDRLRFSKRIPQWLFGEERISNYVPYPAPKI